MGVIERKATGGNDAMNVGMNAEFLTPGMQHAEETDLCTEVSRIARDCQKCLRTGVEQEIIDGLLILQSEWCQFTRKREDYMHVGCREKFPAALFQPTIARLRLTLRAVPVAAGVIRDGAMPAAGALVEMTAECGGATARNGQQDFDMGPAE